MRPLVSTPWIWSKGWMGKRVAVVRGMTSTLTLDLRWGHWLSVIWTRFGDAV